MNTGKWKFDNNMCKLPVGVYQVSAVSAVSAVVYL